MEKYDLVLYSDSTSDMETASHGKWVKASDVESQLTQLKADNAKLREGMRNLKTFEMENVSYSYNDNYRMVDQEIPLEKDYCGDYVEVESIKALLEQTKEATE